MTDAPAPDSTAPPPAEPAADALLDVRDLRMHFVKTRGFFRQAEVQRVRAVDGISFTIRAGETLGLVGESGCGKSTAGRAILQLYEPTGGEVRWRGTDLVQLAKDQPDEFRATYRRKMQMIFQDPYASLNPRMTVGTIIGEPVRTHRLASGRDVQAKVMELMQTVGLDPRYIRRYPHEFSGGQRQRIGIARALASQPEFLVCDEPISALDVSIQAQILNLMEDLQQQFGLTYLFIAHDLSAVHHIADRIAVMYLGHIVELADADTICRQPVHPYSEALISAVPIPDPVVEGSRQSIVLEGDLPSPLNPPTGCPFHTRCRHAWDRCRSEKPTLAEAAPGHLVSCHLLDEPGKRQSAPVTASVEAGAN